MLTLLALAAGTLVSEDATAVLAGVLIGEGAISPLAGVTACAMGIYVGDLVLFAAGRVFGARAFGWRRVSEAGIAKRLSRLGTAGHASIGPLVLGSRLLPGTRLPLYVAAGAAGWSTRAFAGWSALAVGLWTPAIVLASATALPTSLLPGDWLARAAAVALLVGAWRWLRWLLSGPHRGARAAAAVSRLWRWEFWPMWAFYAPVAAWVAMLIVRHRSLGVIAAANPGIRDGGIVGESKYDILRRLPAEWTIPAARLDSGPLDARVWRLAETQVRMQWRFPLVLKPDVGQRGTGVRLVRSLEEARSYLTRERAAVVVQPYHPGPGEAGVFYYRMPWWSTGRILSITDKRFPGVTGDGRSTLADLVWADRRLRMQARTFLSRHGDSAARVLAAGERVALAIAGNHCQGTMFRDGSHLITPALEERIDAIARDYPGFFIGRFDIRYRDVERFKAGEDLAIVELNGTTAESTNIYDPGGSLLGAYRQLFRQWSLVFAIGAHNRAQGAPAASLARLWELLRAHLAARPVYAISD